MHAGPYVIDDREAPKFRINRSALVDPEVLERERRLIFDTCWLYVGHESELRTANEFRTRNVGGRPVIFLRDSASAIRVLTNSCTHRGMMIETRPEGTARFLKCFYHGWSFSTTGELVAMPDEPSYGPNFDKAALCLPSPPHVDSYAGFVFLSWNPDAAPLVDYLAGATAYLDLVGDQSDAGLQVIDGTHLYSMRANWKLLVENSIDGYHAMTTHHRYLKMLKDSGVDLGTAFSSKGSPPRGYDLGNGHAVIAAVDGSQGTALGLGRAFPTESAARKHRERRDRLVEQHGEEWTNRMLAGRNLLIFPNLIVVDLVMGCTVRTFYPSAPDYMEINAWQIQPADEDSELHEMRMTNFLTFWGPAGLATPDDVEALERCQLGYAAHRSAPWNDISRGMSNPTPGFTEELQMRVFWRHWDTLVNGQEHEPEVPLYRIADEHVSIRRRQGVGSHAE